MFSKLFFSHNKRGISLYSHLLLFSVLLIALFTFFIIYLLNYEVSGLKEKLSTYSFTHNAEYLNKKLENILSPAIQLSIINTQDLNDIHSVIEDQEKLKEFISFNIPDLVLHNEYTKIQYDFKDGSNISIYKINAYPRTYFKERTTNTKYIVSIESQNPHTGLYELHIFYYTENIELEKHQTTLLNNTKIFSKMNYSLFENEDFINKTNTLIQQINENHFTISTLFQDKQGIYTVTVNCTDLNQTTENADYILSFFIINSKNYIIYKHINTTHEKLFSFQNISPFFAHSENFLDLVNIFESDKVRYNNSIIATEYENINIINHEGTNFQYTLKDFYVNNQKYKIVIIGNQITLLEQLQSLSDNILFFTICISLLLIAFAHTFSKKISDILKKIDIFAQNVRKNNDTITLRPNTNFLEINNLISTLLSMKKSINKQKSKLLSHQKNLKQTINKRTEELSRALELANKSAKAKSAFLSTMSHELRTPINAILGFSYLFDKSNLTEEQLEQLNNIHSSSEHLLHLINNILDFSKLEEHKSIAEEIPFSIQKICHEVFAMLKPTAEQKHIDFLIKFSLSEDRMLGDPNKLKQIFINFLSNAIKFTECGSVNFIINETSHNSEISCFDFIIKDTGIGISEEQQKLLFEPFYQADASISRKYGGTGLGLSISKQIIELMNGEIHIQSTPKQGTEFVITLCFKNSHNHEIHEAAQKKQLYYTNVKALIVDDNAVNLQLGKALLEKKGIKTEIAESAESALEKIIQNRFDLILMDIQMPKTDGYTATKQIRKLDPDLTKTDVKNIPIIAVTANTQKEDINYCIQSGMNAHIAKPIIPEKLYALIHTFIKE